MKARLLVIFSMILFTAMGNENLIIRLRIPFSSDHPTLPIGSPAPGFSLPGHRWKDIFPVIIQQIRRSGHRIHLQSLPDGPGL